MKIVVNGREYASPDEMPADVRASYERAMATLADKNGNGIPDILEPHLGTLAPSANAGENILTGRVCEGAAILTRSVSEAGIAAPLPLPVTTVITSQKFVINGREYDSLDQLPPEVRRQLESLQGQLLPSRESGLLQPPARGPLNPLDAAEWTPSRGLLATNPVAILFIVIVLTAVVTCAVLAAVGALR